MDTLQLQEETLDLENISKALKDGEVIAFPTETVYGLGALISNEEALKKIYLLKERPERKALIVHISKIEDVKKVAKDIPKIFYLLASHFFPGPVSFILKKRNDLSPLVSSYDTVAVRMPAHGLTLKLIDFLKEPIVGTSANISNEKNPVTFKDVLSAFGGKIHAIIDGGICPIGIPSTIIDLTDGMKILREGFITIDQINAVLNLKQERPLFFKLKRIFKKNR